MSKPTTCVHESTIPWQFDHAMGQEKPNRGLAARPRRSRKTVGICIHVIDLEIDQARRAR